MAVGEIRMMRMKSSGGTRGFSLVELMVVAAIVLIITAVAIPNLVQGMRFLRLRSNATTLANMLQQARMRSVRDNRTYQVVTTVNAAPNATSLFIDLNFDGQYNPGEPVTTLATDVVVNNVGPVADAFIQTAMAPPTGLNPAPPMALQVTFPNNGAPGPTFNPRGVPCLVPGNGYSSVTAVCNTGGAGAPPIGYVTYLQSTTIANNGWSAVTVSPGGRIRTWILAPATPNNWR